MIGASRETVSRAMADFQDIGFISVDKRVITISNPAALMERAAPRP
jgi:CRP-like cAMP-binding protein